MFLDLEIAAQPDNTTCGPTCLRAVYGFWGDTLPLNQLIDEVPALETGGTLGVLLALHALRRGYRARIYTCNLNVFDPTWFTRDGTARADLGARLLARGNDLGDDPKMRVATSAYAELIDRGGEVRMVDLTPRLIAAHLRSGEPILTGLSSTWLYRAVRSDSNDRDDAIRGFPDGHFVVVVGYDSDHRVVHVADPYLPNPLSDGHTYPVSIDRLVCAILLGIVTWDANLLIVTPAASKGADSHDDRR